MKTTVIHHSADFDGLFCREIARKFLPDAELIGWDFGDKPLEIPPEGQIYILDLPVDRVFGYDFKNMGASELLDETLSISQPGSQIRKFLESCKRVIWIDHHKSSIESHPANIPGYRIDGVAACRLAWQWFASKNAAAKQSGAAREGFTGYPYPTKQEFIDRTVSEPLAVRLAGEYDIWDKRDPRAEVFQFGLRSRILHPDWWTDLLGKHSDYHCCTLLDAGEMLQRYQQNQDASLMNTARCNSLTFASKDIPETGHDALIGFYWTGKAFNVSMYHAKHRTDIDLSQIAVKHGGGGHRGACGFESYSLPFVP